MKAGKFFAAVVQSLITQRVFKLFKSILLIFGIIYLLLVVFAFTSGPFWVYYWLGTSNIKPVENTEYFLLLGGGGMPEESNLMRSYYAAEAALKVPDAKIIIALPGDTGNAESSICLLAHELMVKGVSPERIIYEPHGTNTRAQALRISALNINGIKEKDVTIITSPEHMKRSILTFRKLGFANVDGYPAFHMAIESDIKFDNRKIGGRNYIPDIGNNISFRYRFWTHLKYEILIIREFAALFYYKLNGWI